MDTPLEELFESSLRMDVTENTLRQIPSSRGVLLFADADRHPIQILSAANLRRTALAKLSESKSQEPARKADLRPIARFLHYTPISCELHSTWLYNRLVHILFPDKAKELICLPPSHCVSIDPDQAWASFAPSSQPCQDGTAVCWGPFPTRKAAEFFARTYNEAFELCRNRRFCQQGQNCSYFQMGLCAAPCLQKGEEAKYRQTARQAIEAACGPIENLQATLAEQMKTWAGKMQFEKAQTLKNRIDQLSKLKGSAYRWTRRMDTLKILHIAEGSSASSFENLRQKSPLYSGYLITYDRIEKAPNFFLSSIPSFLDALSRTQTAHGLISDTPAEHLGLVSLFLYKSRPPGLWMDLGEKSALDETMLKEVMTECFRKNPPAESP
jgi:excinuclease UvrABC nuclease subunit